MRYSWSGWKMLQCLWWVVLLWWWCCYGCWVVWREVMVSECVVKYGKGWLEGLKDAILFMVDSVMVVMVLSVMGDGVGWCGERWWWLRLWWGMVGDGMEWWGMVGTAERCYNIFFLVRLPPSLSPLMFLLQLECLSNHSPPFLARCSTPIQQFAH